MAVEVEIIGTFTDNASGPLSSFGNVLGGLGNIVSGIRDAFEAAVGFITPFAESAMESQQAVAELEQVLVATGGAAGLTSQELQNMADELQGVTMFSDEAILAGQSMLLTFRNIGEDTFPRATEAMLDMGQMFGSVDAAAVQLGKALNDPIAGISALQRIGVTFSEGQREQIENFMEMGDIAGAQNVILTELESQIGGVAEAMGETFAGQIEIAKNRLDSFREAIGGTVILLGQDLLGAFMSFAEASPLQDIQTFFEALNSRMEAGMPALEAFGYTILTNVDGFETFARGILNVQGAIDDAGWFSPEFWEAAFGDGPRSMLSSFISDFENLTGIEFSVSGLGEALVTAIQGIDWEGASQALADGVSSIDWGRVGNVIAEGLGYLGLAIGTILSEIDWSRLLNSLGNALADLIGGLFGFVDWEDMIANAEVGFRYVGTQIVEGLREGFQSAWSNFTGLPALLFNNFITSVKATLGIFSPSTVFANIGRDIVLGLIGGFTAYWDDLVRIATSSLDNFLNIFGIDLSFGGASASGLGTAGTGTAPGTGGTTTGGQTVINIYAASYWGVSGPEEVDCVSPHPLVASSGNQLVTSGF